MGGCHLMMDSDTMRRIARELYRRSDQNASRGDRDGHLIAGFAAAVAGDLHARAIRLDQLEQMRVEALRAPTVELPIIQPVREVRHEVDEVTVTYRYHPPKVGWSWGPDDAITTA